MRTLGKEYFKIKESTFQACNKRKASNKENKPKRLQIQKRKAKVQPGEINSKKLRRMYKPSGRLKKPMSPTPSQVRRSSSWPSPTLTYFDVIDLIRPMDASTWVMGTATPNVISPLVSRDLWATTSWCHLASTSLECLFQLLPKRSKGNWLKWYFFLMDRFSKQLDQLSTSDSARACCKWTSHLRSYPSSRTPTTGCTSSPLTVVKT